VYVERPTASCIMACSVAVLMGLGLVMLLSTSTVAESGFTSIHFFKKQLAWVAIASCLIFLFSCLGFERLRGISKFLLGLSFVGLIAVFVPGLSAPYNGAYRWVNLRVVSVQPSEFVRIALIIYMADRLTRKQQRIREFFNGFLPPVVILVCAFGLIVMEPDLGGGLMTAAVLLAMLLVAGIRLAHAVPIFIVSLPFMLYFVATRLSYALERVVAFMDPAAHAAGKGYQILQSLIALGSGGVNGVGLGRGMQKLWFLPEGRTDFIFSIIGEEMGFIGTTLVMGLLGVLVWQGVTVAKKCNDMYGKLLAFGLSMAIGVQAAVNIGVATACLPPKGTSLPFVSFGGSSLLASSIAVGILIDIASRQREEDELLGAVRLEGMLEEGRIS